MKRKSVLGVFFIVAIVAGLAYIGRTSAQNGFTNEEMVNSARPESSSNQALLVDDFTATAGTLVSNTGWGAHSGVGTNSIATVTGSLSYTGWPSSGIGNSVAMTTTGEDDNKTFPPQTSGTVYAAAMINVSASQTTGDYFFHVFDGPISGNKFLGRVFVKKDPSSTNYALGIQKGSTVNTVYTPFSYALNTTHLIVVKYTFVAGATNDTVDLIVDPTLGGSEPAPTVSATVDATVDATDIRGVALRQGSASNAATVQVDGIRAATSWTTLTAPAPNRPADFDGDGRTDYAVYRNNGGQLRWYWRYNGEGTGSEIDWGAAGDTVVTADFDGDGKSDVTVWRPGTQGFFYILQSSNNTVRVEPFGQTGDDPSVVGDYDGDGKADVAVYRTGAQAFWYYRTVPGGFTTFMPWGTTGDIPAPGDYDGDGKMDFVVRRSGTPSIFWRNMTTAGIDVQMFGFPTDVIVPGDYDGDGKTDIAVVRNDGTSYTWFYLPSSGVVPPPAVTFITIPFAAAGDVFAQGDYDGDGKTDPAIWRAGSPGIFWVRNSSSGTITPFVTGASTDGAVAAFNNH